MKNKTRTLGLILLAGIFCTSMAAAQERHERDPKERDAMMQKMSQELALSPEQKTKMDALRAEGEGKQKANFETLKSKKDALRDMLDGAAPDQAKALALAAEITTLEGTMMQARIDHVFKLRAILTPEQFKKLEELRKKDREERKGGEGMKHER